MNEGLTAYYNNLKRLHSLSHLNITLISADGDELFHICRSRENKTLSLQIANCLNEIVSTLADRSSNGHPSIIEKNGFTFSVLRIQADNETAYLIIGPYCIDSKDRRSFNKDDLPVYSEYEVESFIPLFTEFSINSTGFQSKSENTDFLFAKLADSDSNDQQIIDNVLAERGRAEAIKSGDTELLESLMGSSFFIEPEHYDISGPYLRKYKNLALVGNTLSCRSAEAGGLPVFYSRPMCAKYAAMIEEADTFEMIARLMDELSMAYCIKVKEYKNRNYSSTMNKIISYIEAHLSEEIQLSDLSYFTGLSYHYISHLIKKEYGGSFSKLINELRIQRSINYLMRGIPVHETAEKTGYKSSAHFCSSFKRIVGITATEWISENKI